MEKSPPLMSPEQIEKRRKIHTIVATYRKRHSALCKLLKEKDIAKDDTTHHGLTDTLLHTEIETNLFNELATIADKYLNELSKSERIKALDQASDFI